MWQKINKRFPISLILIAAYPAVSLLAVNFYEIEPRNVYRPLIFSFLIAAAIFFAFQKIFKDREKAGVIATLFFFILFIYGRAYEYLFIELKLMSSLGDLNHLFLILGTGIFFSLLIWIYDKTRILESATITVFSATLLLLPSYQIVQNFLREPYPFTPAQVEIPDAFYEGTRPDIYHIVLDAYAREDQLARLGFDNSAFIETLRQQGFYVADCARSNYSRTALSLASILNLDYLWRVVPDQDPGSRNDAALFAALSNNLAQETLREAGYTFITTKNGFVWYEMPQHADIFIAPDHNSFFAPYLLPFERLFVVNSIFRILLDLGYLETIQDGYFLYGEHYEYVTTALNQLKEIPNMPEPKYIYFHLIVPHPPNVLSPDGSIAPDLNDPEGYLRNVEFINNALPPILAGIIEKSETPPIILLHGDHSYMLDNDHRFDILHAVYYPEAEELLYPTISPMNTYRLIFKRLFGLDTAQLREMSLQADIGHPFGKQLAELPALPAYCP